MQKMEKKTLRTYCKRSYKPLLKSLKKLQKNKLVKKLNFERNLNKILDSDQIHNKI